MHSIFKKSNFFLIEWLAFSLLRSLANIWHYCPLYYYTYYIRKEYIKQYYTHEIYQWKFMYSLYLQNMQNKRSVRRENQRIFHPLLYKYVIMLRLLPFNNFVHLWMDWMGLLFHQYRRKPYEWKGEITESTDGTGCFLQ